MAQGSFASHAAKPGNFKWTKCIERQDKIYSRQDDVRSDFERDYNRILHSTAYRRLKHKTQVFFATSNDHICTRIEHVNHVTSVSYTISKFLGLNTELSNAIALGHDIGHAPFGHAGETVLKKIAKGDLGINFWHECNSLRFADNIETLEGPTGKHTNLNLTYAVRDGIICHCGEVNQNGIRPRDNFIDLETISRPNEVDPYTWEGCVVKIADKISYLGRDIEDAFTLKILSLKDFRELRKIASKFNISVREINNTVIIHNFISDICKNSDPGKGILLSNKNVDFINELKDFNYDRIYFHERLNNYKKYIDLVLTTIYCELRSFYKDQYKIRLATERYPILIPVFEEWLQKYNMLRKCPNKYFYIHKLYDLAKEKEYARAIIDFISGMTDSFAIRVFSEITTF